MSENDNVFILGPNNTVVSIDKSLVPQGDTFYATREEALQALVDAAAPAGWMHSNKPVADYVYAKNGVVYFLYNVSSAVGGTGITYLQYEATGLRPEDYEESKGRWGPDAFGNDRQGPLLQYTPPMDAEVLNYDPAGLDGELTRNLTVSSLNLVNTPQGFNLGNYISETMGELRKNYPWLFNEINGQYPGLTLFLQSVTSGSEITQEQLNKSGLNSGWTGLSIDYLNATLSAMDVNNPDKVIINGEEQTNKAFTKLETSVSNSVDTALGEIGINADVFKKENSELYTDIVQVMMRGKYADTDQFADFLGSFLGIDGYEVAKDSLYYNDFTDLANEINNATNFTPHIDLDTYKSSQRGKQSLINYIGIGMYNALSSDEKKKLISLYARDENAGLAAFQNLFDNDIRFERFANKGLNYSLVTGPYRQSYEQIFGESVDETSTQWLDSLGLSYTEAKKAYRNQAYSEGNDKFMRDIATTLQGALGGPVIR
jgi:hypothetical protein|tara:strand:+ start:2823 stop:4283 length:1461 start_codon:yes stop_codon:yes gene_type:complete